MDFEIQEKQNDVTYEIPAVRFPTYEEYLEKANAIAAYIGTLEVNEENIKETKHTLAEARKLTDRLTNERIRMKKDILQNFTTFEDQVKAIVTVIDKADKELRTKVKELEEAEREEKKNRIREIWDKRMAVSPEIIKVIPDAFDRWLSPKHLNKSTPMKTVEAEMTEWIRKTSADVETVSSMGEEYVAAYSKTGDLSKAINEVKMWQESIELAKDVMSEQQIEMAVFTVYGTKDIALTERLLKENEIIYRREK